MAERALQEMRSLVRGLQEEVTQAAERKKREQEEEEEEKKRQAELKAQQEEQKKNAARSTIEKATREGEHACKSSAKNESSCSCHS